MKSKQADWLIIFLCFLFLNLNTGVSAQEKQSESASISDSVVLSDSTGSKHALYTSTGFGNEMLCMGVSISGDRPYYFGSVSYGLNNELFVSATSYHLSAYKPFLAFHTLSLSYSHVFNSWFDISSGLSRYQVADDLSDILFNSFYYGDLTLGVDWRILYSKISVNRIFSDFSTNYFQIRNSRYFQTPEFFNGKANVTFDPYFTVLSGTLISTTTTEGTTVGITSPFGSSNGSGRNSSGGGTGSATTTLTSTHFGLMEIDLGLPVAFNTDMFTIEAEPGLIIPLYHNTGITSQNKFVFNLSCYFKIF